jgi:ABC-type Fe3+ transport system substrate-binding protein
MTADYDTCRDNLEKFVNWYASSAGQRNEATTRLQLVDELFFDCLG